MITCNLARTSGSQTYEGERERECEEEKGEVRRVGRAVMGGIK